MDASSVFYRTLDAVRNLRVAVCIRRLPEEGRLRGGEGTEASGMGPEDPGWCSWAVFDWQQKQFGPQCVWF